MKTLFASLFLALIALSGAKGETALLLRTVSFTSDSGIANFPAGRTYEVIQEGADAFVLKTADGRNFSAPKADVTTDPVQIAANAAKVAAATPAHVQVVKNVVPSPTVAVPPAVPPALSAQQYATKRHEENVPKIAELRVKASVLRAEIKKHGGDTSPENRQRMAELSKIKAEIESLY